MAFPDFYDPQKVGTLYIPDVGEAVRVARDSQVRPASEDNMRTALLLIDAQVDFVHEDGALPVPGAVEDTRRTIEWIYKNIEGITSVIASLDSHLPIQIFSPAWWQDESGEHPQPYTVISSEEVQNGAWKPLYEQDWSKEYVERLEEHAKKQLMIWPYHTLMGTPGHSITPALYEAIAYHSAARKTQPNFIMKGTIPKTEHYSLFEPEVKTEALENGGLNQSLLESLAGYDRIYVAGQAKSHCVLESVTSMMRFYEDQPETIQKIHILQDAMSSVVSPGIDFEAIATETLSHYAAHGLHLTTTDAQ